MTRKRSSLARGLVWTLTQHLLNELPHLFSDRRKKQEGQDEELLAELYRKIGQLNVELEWLKKKSQTLQLQKKGR